MRSVKVTELDAIVDESGSIEEVIEGADLMQMVGQRDDDGYSIIVVATQDALAIVRETDSDVTLEIV